MNTSTQNADQRNFPRIQTEVPIEVKALSHQDRQRPDVKSASQNISGGGVCFAAPEPIAPDTVISLNLSVPSAGAGAPGAPIVAICQVAWCRAIDKTKRFLIGVKFLDILEDDFHALMAYIGGSKGAA